MVQNLLCLGWLTTMRNILEKIASSARTTSWSPLVLLISSCAAEVQVDDETDVYESKQLVHSGTVPRFQGRPIYRRCVKKGLLGTGLTLRACSQMDVANAYCRWLHSSRSACASQIGHGVHQSPKYKKEVAHWNDDAGRFELRNNLEYEVFDGISCGPCGEHTASQ